MEEEDVLSGKFVVECRAAVLSIDRRRKTRTTV